MAASAIGVGGPTTTMADSLVFCSLSALAARGCARRLGCGCVIGGPGAFMVPVNDWEQFAEAVRRKLVLEIGAVGTPAPKVIPAQFVLEEPYDCLIGEKIWQQRGWQFDEFNP